MCCAQRPFERGGSLTDALRREVLSVRVRAARLVVQLSFHRKHMQVRSIPTFPLNSKLYHTRRYRRRTDDKFIDKHLLTDAPMHCVAVHHAIAPLHSSKQRHFARANKLVK